MYTYCIHGLNIVSPLALKETQDLFEDNHLKIDWISQRFWRPSIEYHHTLLNAEKEPVAQINKYVNSALSIDYFNCGFFYYFDKKLTILKETSDNDLFHAVLTTQILPLMASLIHTTFHGGAVAIKKRGIVYLAPEAFGKSTLTSHLQKKGFDILSDDAVSLNGNSAQSVIYSGLPEIRLNSDSVEALNWSLQTKKSKLAKWSFAINNLVDLPTQLQTIFVLNPQTQDQTYKNRSLESQEALQHLLKNQFRLDIWNKKILSREFNDITKLLKTVSVRELTYPFEYSSLEWVEKQIKQGLFHESPTHASI